MKQETVDIFLKALRYAHSQGMLYEWTKDVLEDLKVEDLHLKEAIVYANREWDL